MTDPAALLARLRSLAADGALDLPPPGSGATPERFARLAAFGVQDVALARLAEAHADGVAILAEAGVAAPAGALLGVWASDGPDGRLGVRRDGPGWRLDGTKQWCSGIGIVDEALVTAHDDDRLLLVRVAAGQPGTATSTAAWATAALAATATGTMTFDDVHLPADAVVGPDRFYLDRPGFWHGAVGVAACWLGGALGVLRTMTSAVRATDPHGLAHLGVARAATDAMTATLGAAAGAIDADPQDRSRAGRARALSTRHVVHEGCVEVLARSARALGPAPLALDDAHATRVADLALYLRQHHAERDLEVLGADTRATSDGVPGWPS